MNKLFLNTGNINSKVLITDNTIKDSEQLERNE